MRNLIRLTWVLVRGARNPMVQGGRRRLKAALFILLLALAFVPIMVQIGIFAHRMLTALAPLGQEGVVLAFAFSFASLLILTFGVPSTLVIYYFAQDLEALLVLPLRPSVILSAKFLTALTVEYAAEAVFLLPVFVAYAAHAGCSAALVLAAAVVFLLLPVIPVAMASLLVMTAMQFTDLAGNRDRFAKIAGVALMAVVLGLNYGLQRAGAAGADPMQIAATLMRGDGLWGFVINRLFPACAFGVKAFLEAGSAAGWGGLLLFAVTAAGAFGVLLPLGEKFYLRGVQGGRGNAKSGAVRAPEKGLPLLKAGSAWRSYLNRELVVLFRDPVFFMNCVVTNFLWPVFAVVFSVTSPGGGIPQAAFLARFYSGSGIIHAVWLGLGMLITAMNGVASSAISREGRQIGSVKILPMPFSRQLLAKAGAAAVLGAVGCVLMAGLAFGVFRMPFSILPSAVLLMAAGIVFSACTGMLIDLHFPKLFWDNAYKAVKQNINVPIHMAVCAVTAGLTFWLVKRTNGRPDRVLAALSAAFILIDAGLIRVLTVRGAAVFGRTEA
jgi:ABC-2 type transport system permease protein